jgi:hypothetical protein
MNKNTASSLITKSEYFRDVNAQFRFEEWMIEDNSGIYGLAAAFELAGLKDGENIRMSAQQQRRFFGKKLFGNQCIRIRNGQFEVVRSVCYGTDWDTQHLTDIIDAEAMKQ